MEGMKKKKHLERNLMENEIFTEAVPSAMIMTFILVLVSKTCLTCADNTEGILIVGEPGTTDYYLFFVTLSTSVLSASLGLAKCLKVGASQISLNCILMIVVVLTMRK